MKKESFGIILPITLLAYFLILMDNSIIFTSSTQIGESLNLTDTSLAWVSNAYTMKLILRIILLSPSILTQHFTNRKP